MCQKTKMSRYKKEISFSSKLMNSENSCVEVHKSIKHLSLFPYHLKNVSDSIRQVLNEDIGKYSKPLNGILMGYKNIKVLSTLGDMVSDTCFTHINVQADFIIFKPIPGKELPAVVIKKNFNHIGCLVYENFNVSLPKPEGPKEWFGSHVDIGQDVTVRITYVNLEAKLPYIKAEFVEQACEPSIVKRKKKKTENSQDEDVLQTTNEDIDGETNIEKKKSKKKKKLEPIDQIIENVEETPKKRKRKFNEQNEEECEVIVEEKQRKRKRKSLEDCTEEKPKKRKKKTMLDSEFETKIKTENFISDD